MAVGSCEDEWGKVVISNSEQGEVLSVQTQKHSARGGIYRNANSLNQH